MEEETIIDVSDTNEGFDSRRDIHRPPPNDTIVQIVCSPQMKCVATITHMDAAIAETWNGVPTYGDDDDQLFKEANLWSVVENSDGSEELGLKHEVTIKGHQINEPRSTLWAVSDDMYIVFKTNYFYYNFEVFNAKGKRKELYFPNEHNVVNQLDFIKTGELIVALIEPVRCIYVFKLDQYNEWACSYRLELSYFCDAFITVEGKLILFDDKLFQLTIWDIITLTFEINYLIDWCYKVKHVEVNEGGEFLAVHAAYVQGENENTKKSMVYVFSLETGINIAFREYDERTIIDKIYFIAYDAGERLLIVSRDQFNDEPTTHLMNPFALKNPVPATKLFDTDVKIRDPYIIKFDNVIGLINGELAIYERLVRKDWIHYLRNDLDDYNRIFVISDSIYITKMIKDELSSEENIFKKSLEFPLGKTPLNYDGSFLRWNLYSTPSNKPKFGPRLEIEALLCYKVDQDKIEWRPIDGIYKRAINPSFPPPEHTKRLKIIECKCLDNDDLLMLTTLGILIWTVYPPKGIRLHYYWGRGKISNEKEFNIGSIFLGIGDYPKIFPESKFLIIIKNKSLKFGGEERSFFFKELLEDYISDKFFMVNYGSILIEAFLFLKEDEWVEKFCKACHDIIFTADSLKSASNIQLLTIIIKVLPQLLQRNSAYLNKFLSQIAFVMPLADPDPVFILDSEIVEASSTPHLCHFGTYNLTKRTSPLFDKFRRRFGYKIEVPQSPPADDTPSLNEFRKLLLKIQSNNWNELEKPKISPIILKAAKIEE
ncbi:19206_t:CDS:2, partial [Cetraspora pellucida]